jgi:hypothetical protein
VTTIRRRKVKPRRAPESMIVPGARDHLYEQAEANPDPRSSPPTPAPVLAALKRGEAVEIDAWELPGDLWRTFGHGLDGMNVRVRVDADGTVTAVGP